MSTGRRFQLLTSEDLRRGLRMAMCLPLAPPQFLQDGVTLVNNHLQRFPRGAIVGRFIEYWQRQWGRINIYVYGVRSRTNNLVESYHASLSSLVGRRHPNFWVFVSFLQRMENSKAVDLIRIIRDPAALPLRRRPAMVTLDNRISKYTPCYLPHCVTHNTHKLLLKIFLLSLQFFC